ncbi:LuxR C-terminal-related transcriptional regulator [Kitasatospora sp. NPDC093102]|uniref:helix-turn-helix transcriptional regulator n=1 Tax=Kitasatospora sp. NPDC093102 TaxID=3155069 RepID=UPI00341E2D44
MDTGKNAEEALAQMLYRTARSRGSWAPEDIAEELACSPLEVEQAIDRLKHMNLLVPAPSQPSGYQAVGPSSALSRLISLERELTDGWLRERTNRQEQILSLLREFPLQSGPSPDASIDVLPTGPMVNDFIEEQTLEAKVLEQAMHPGGVPPVELVDEMIHRDRAALHQGVRLEAIYAHHLVEIPYLHAYLAEVSRHGADVRVAPAVPLRMIVIDSNLAILPIDPQNTARGAFAIRSHHVIGALRAVFHFHWAAAAPLVATSEGQQFDELLDPSEKMVIHMMAMGTKDEAIARQLGISTRTLSRKISQILERLGVQTRFQAAVKLARVGVIDLAEPVEQDIAG